MCYYTNIMLKYLHFRSRHDQFGFYLRHKRRNVWRKMMSKSDLMTPWRHARGSSHTPLVRRHFLALVRFTDIPVGYARIPGPRQANLCLRAFRHDKFQLRMPSHSEGPGIWLSVWRFLLIHCLYARAAKVLARLRGCAGSPEPSLLA